MIDLNIPLVQNKRIAVKLTPEAEKVFKQGHPWIFSGSIAKVNKQGNTGDLAIIYSQKDNKVIGVGLFDAESPIRIKVLDNSGPCTVDQVFFSKRIQAAYAQRASLRSIDTNAYRLLFGENDGFPGLIADVYAAAIVLKLYSAIWMPYLNVILDEIRTIVWPNAIVLRLSRSLENQFSDLHDGAILYGHLDDPVVEFLEYGVRFRANVIKGHKTGFFLDHRQNRSKVGTLATGKHVLDVFSYAGGFSVHALVNGAKSVTSMDISEQALAVAKENAELNNFTGKHATISGDAFSLLPELIQANKTFDLIIIDPPSFAKSKKEIATAKKKYFQLAQMAALLCAARGIVVLASCSSRVEADDFFQINDSALRHAGRKFELLEKTFHDIDHPVRFKEGAYLKCGYYRRLK